MKKYKYRQTFTYKGKRYSVYADTKFELGQKAAKRKIELEKQYIKESESTVTAWSEKCIEVYKKNTSKKTLQDFNGCVKKNILAEIGDKPIKDIKPIDCQQILNNQEGKSKSQINKVYQALRFIFHHAYVEGMIIKDPTLNLTKPAGTYHARRSLTPEERVAVLSVAKTDRRYYLYLLILLCGCRPSEAAQCKGADIVDIDGYKMLHIQGTKTANADRFVPIPNELYSIIKNTPKNEFIALNHAGNRITNQKMLWKSFKRQLNLFMGAKTYRNAIIEELVSPDLVPYCFRHEYCSNLARCGVDIRTAQKLMGHASISMTANIYTHINVDDLKAAADIVDQK